ncbi:GNAT family N-acetyltransferase [Frigidibacter sp. RF13]|uniref:GNAT family N-acetyltransferase n=1 Tax=Frigidibacter sp. RF13 TaxID=2997340 RepID=UPI00226EAD9A|nr:GNAT family N-acetyltransferase [Frigidibacter sp. RF13]MCY1125854.1 GNAT family N-acetyltransferase [Frigidibacter sp. RF13]
MTALVDIRDMTAADEADWRRLWAGFLAYYDIELAPGITDFTWTRLLDPANPLTARMAYLDGRAMGFAIHQLHPSTWVMGEDCYLEDLFVAEEARGRGIGRALIEDLKALSRAKGAKRLHWFTDNENSRARALYDQLAESDGHIRYRTTL